MHPHSYTFDSQSKAQELASTISSSTSTSQIFSACASVEAFLHSHSPAQSRHFFSLTFPSLICKLFGFDDAASSSPAQPHSPHGWIDTVLESNATDLANKVFALLSPNGVLFHSISSVDRLSLVKYVFPTERLPEWTRFLLSSEKDYQVLSDLCPLFKGKVKEDSIKGSLYQIQLNVFEYFMFWFAYYPVCRGKCENFDMVLAKKVKKSRLENWTSSIPGFSTTKSSSEQKLECNLYIRLLYAYLRAYVPMHDLNSHQPYRSCLLHYSSGYEASHILRTEYFINTLIHFWLVDNDFSPLSVNVCKSFGVSFPFQSVLGEKPPTSGLAEVVKLFVKFLNLSSVLHNEGPEIVEYSSSPRWKVSGSFDSVKSRDVVSVSPWVQSPGCWYLWVQRPLYRFILRTFLFCPVGSSIKNVSQVYSVWISYMEPWSITWNEFMELDAICDGPRKNGEEDESQSEICGYSPSWQIYVLSNYLYYSSLIMHFIGFAHKFLHTDVEVIVQMVMKVMAMLTSSEQLTDLIRNMDTSFHSKSAVSAKSKHSSLYRFAPSIREQLQDWEDGLCESDADGSFLHENWNKCLRLFSNGEDGGQQLLQLFILRAEAELQAISSDNPNLKHIDSLKAQANYLFGGHSIKALSFSPDSQLQKSRIDIFKPRKVNDHTLCDIRYKGDWMKRPISNDEVGWLAKVLVRLSAWLNESLGLDRPEPIQLGPSYAEVSGNLGNVCGPMETVKTILCAFASWLLILKGTLVRSMRKYGWRINLRLLASKKVLMILFLLGLFSVLKNVW